MYILYFYVAVCCSENMGGFLRGEFSHRYVSVKTFPQSSCSLAGCLSNHRGRVTKAVKKTKKKQHTMVGNYTGSPFKL